MSKQWQEAVEAKANEAKALYEAYQKSAATLSAAQKTAQEDAIVAKEKEAAELRKQYFGPEGELMKKRQELMGPVQDAIYNAVKAIATERGYDVVIDRASAQSMILLLHALISAMKFLQKWDIQINFIHLHTKRK